MTDMVHINITRTSDKKFETSQESPIASEDHPLLKKATEFWSAVSHTEGTTKMWTAVQGTTQAIGWDHPMAVKLAPRFLHFFFVDPLLALGQPSIAREGERVLIMLEMEDLTTRKTQLIYERIKNRLKCALDSEDLKYYSESIQKKHDKGKICVRCVKFSKYRCSCLKERYCSKECQREDLQAHSFICTHPKSKKSKRKSKKR